MYINRLNGILRSGATIRILTALIIVFMINSAHSDPITKNEVEDLNLVVSQFVFGQPNALFIMDVSGSMGRNFGGTQIGRWTPDSDLGTIQDCRNGLYNNDNDLARITHCAENTANLTACGSVHCKNGTCDEQEEFDNFKQCVYNHPDSSITSDSLASFIFDAVCGGLFCNDSEDREAAAAALESAAGLTTCASNTLECHNWEFDGSPACNTPLDFSTWRDECMMVLQDIEINREANCTAMDDAGNLVNENCSGRPAHGSSRLDVTLSVIFDLLDADNSLDGALCSDNEGLFDGTSPISCMDYMNTPFRNVSRIARDDGGSASTRRLPISGNSGDNTLINYLTDNDAEELSIRLRPLTYSGLGNWSEDNTDYAGCRDNTTFNVAQGGFAGASETSFKNVWRFFRRLEPDGGTPLAFALGFDDSDSNGGQGGNEINDDALGVFSTELKTDPSIECRPEFVIILTDGEDTCSGDCNATWNSCNGRTTTNANRRSVVQAVSNLRTHFVRNPVSNRGDNFKKEIMTFVIGLGIPEEDTRARRAINAMALVGGTHNEGIIQHTDPDGVTFGNVDINDQFPSDPEFDVFKSLAKAEGLDSSDPSNARLQGCTMGNEDENGTCSFNSTEIFNNDFFDNGTPLPNDKKLMDGFAFFPQNATELRATLEDIFAFIDTFTTAGVSPAAPQSSTSVALRDRIFLSILTPITDKRFWQGRLALYGFVDDPENEGNRVVVRDPGGVDLTEIDTTSTLISQYGIFDPDDGTLVKQNAQKFHWESGKLLAERNLSSDPRNILTINPDFSSANSVVTSNGGVIRYIGQETEFNNSLPPETFGISDSDVVNPIPSYCTAEPPGGFADCTAAGVDCDLDINSDECKTCVKNCLRDRVVSFISGKTDILPQGDPLGGPEIAGTSDETNFETIGTNCPNQEDDTGSFDTCSVRLGDIFHSDPIVVGSPSALFFDTGFTTYARAYRDRSSSVYVGANDGGIHSFHAGELVGASPTNPQENPFTGADVELPFFDEGTGWEMFFYVPPTFLPDSIAPDFKNPESHLHETFPDIAFAPDYRFGDLKTFVVDNLVQRSFFDGSPLIFDAFVDGYDNDIAPDSDFCPVDTGPAAADGEINECGKEWHTLAVAGYRNGGGAYTALDITNPHCTVGGTPEKCTSVGEFAANNNDGRFNGDGPDYPKHLWTVFDRDFGNTWSKPAPGRVRMKTKIDGEDVAVDRWLLFAGGGLDPLDTNPSDGVDFGNAFYAIDAATGKIVYKFHPDNPIPSTLPDNSVRQAMDCDMASSPGVFDLNNDGYVDLAYIGDTCGRMWRFDVSRAIVDTGNDVSQTDIDGNAVIEAPNWTAGIAFCANTESECGVVTSSPSVPQNNIQPIYFAPTLVIDDLGRKHVIFNTGSRRDPSSVDSFGKLFNIIDPYIPAFLAGGESGSSIEPTMYRTEDDFDSGEIIELVPQTGLGEDASPQFTTQGGSTVNNQGQFIVIFPDNVSELSGEKGIGTPVVINRVLVFTTFAPDSGVEDNPCINKPGVGRAFALDYLSGEPALGRVPGADTLLSGSSSQKEDAAGLSIAEGMPSPARLTFGARGSVVMTVAFAGGPTAGGAQFLVWELPPFPSRTQTLFWEEIM